MAGNSQPGHLPAGWQSAEIDVPFPASILARLHINDLAWGALLAACWFWTCTQLALTWAAFPNYSFGYFVPWIALALAARRISAAPGCFNRPPESTRASFTLFATLSTLAWIAFLLSELVREFDPHWRIVPWGLIAAASLLTGCWLWTRGGSPLLRHLLFPIAFMWTAVPWPTNIEQPVTLGLQTFVAQATVWLVSLMKISAWRVGNIIDLASGSAHSPRSVTIDSACSGINSLQVSVMASLFLGELFSLNLARRITLFFVACCIAVVGNLARSTILVLLSNQGGDAEFHRFHNLAGCCELGFIFSSIVTAAWLLARRDSPTPGTITKTNAQSLSIMESRSARFGLTLLGAFALIPLITSAWFAVSPGGPIRAQKIPMWTLRAQPPGADWHIKPTELSEADADTLRCTESQTLSVSGPVSALVYHFFWLTDSSTGFGHTPDICMTGAGWQQVGATVDTALHLGTAEIPARLYQFERDGKKVDVLQSVWYGGSPLESRTDFPDTKDSPRGARLTMLWNAPRRRGLEALNVYLNHAQTTADDVRRANMVLIQVAAPNRAQDH